MKNENIDFLMLYKNLLNSLSIRLFDFLISLIAILLLSPIFLTLYFLIFFASGAPVFFYQERVGKNKRLFRLIKFRSMYNDWAEKLISVNHNLLVDGVNKYTYQTNSVNDSRITPVGKFIRKYSLDELPQFFNVLLGHMSIVGPRPDVIEQNVHYSLLDWESRLSIRPGITGLAQIKGRSTLSFQSRLKFDLFYVRKRTFYLYLFVIFKTFTAIFNFGNSN